MSETEGLFSFTTPKVMSHPHLFEAKPFVRKGKAVGDPKFSATFLLAADDPDLKDLKTMMAQLAKAKWPSKDLRAEIAANRFAWPVGSGDKAADKRTAAGKSDGEFQRGFALIAARGKYAPRLSAIVNGRIVEYESGSPEWSAAKPKFFFGAECLAQIKCVPYDAVDDRGLDGIAIYLNMVMATGKGTRISGGASAADVFKGYVGSSSMEDPTAGSDLDDDIPF